MSYFSSGNVKVFPSSYRTLYTAGKYTSEENFTNLVKSLAGRDSFVVDFIPGSVTTIGKLKVIIDGYYFEIDNFEVKDNKTLYIRKGAGYLVNFGDATRNLDTTAGFTGLSDADGAGSGEFHSLEVCKNSKLVNIGYINALCDSDGNWINISNITINENGKIDPSSIDFNSIQNYIYAAKFIAEGAIKLGTWNQTTGVFTPYSVGGYNGGVTTTIKFADGVPTESIKITYSTNQPSGTASNGDIWFVYE